MATPTIKGATLLAHEDTTYPWLYRYTVHWNHPLSENFIKDETQENRKYINYAGDFVNKKSLKKFGLSYRSLSAPRRG